MQGQYVCNGISSCGRLKKYSSGRIVDGLCLYDSKMKRIESIGNFVVESRMFPSFCHSVVDWLYRETGLTPCRSSDNEQVA